MFIEFGDSLISTSCIVRIKRENYCFYYGIKIEFNQKIKDDSVCLMKFETEEEMNEKWNELKTMLCPMKTLAFDGSVKLEKDSNPFFIHADLANGNPV